ncbi:hypothetical protein BDF19DRAFT_431686 [Syncephalis fuscata]|nr:hypothetical protein BDF19DRAFT_431686 [Syncephalis fuscata]
MMSHQVLICCYCCDGISPFIGGSIPPHTNYDGYCYNCCITLLTYLKSRLVC